MFHCICSTHTCRWGWITQLRRRWYRFAYLGFNSNFYRIMAERRSFCYQQTAQGYRYQNCHVHAWNDRTFNRNLLHNIRWVTRCWLLYFLQVQSKSLLDGNYIDVYGCIMYLYLDGCVTERYLKLHRTKPLHDDRVCFLNRHFHLPWIDTPLRNVGGRCNFSNNSDCKHI